MQSLKHIAAIRHQVSLFKVLVLSTGVTVSCRTTEGHTYHD